METGKWLRGTVGCIDVVLVEEVEEEELLEDILVGCDSSCRCESYRDAMVVDPVLSWPSNPWWTRGGGLWSLLLLSCLCA